MIEITFVKKITMNKKTLITATISMALAVILGAMGAHYLKEGLQLPVDKLDSWKTGVFYQIIHSISILFTVILANQLQIKAKAVVRLFFAGILLFSGSIYLLTLNEVWQISAFKSVLGPITPLGGLCFIAGWIVLTRNLVLLKND